MALCRSTMFGSAACFWFVKLVEKAIAQLQQSSWAASTTLVRLLGSPSDAIRLRAAQTILDQANKGLELIDFEERLAALEDQSEQRRPVRATRRS